MKTRAFFVPLLIALTACTARLLDLGGGDAGTPDATASAASCNAADSGSDLCSESAFTGLSPATQANIVLWLDPSNLPDVGNRFTIWPDRTAHHNDAHATATNPGALPNVIPGNLQSVRGGVELLHGDYPTLVGGPLEIANNSSFDLGTGDFVMLTSWTATDKTPGSCFFGKQPASPSEVGGKVLFGYLFGDAGGAPTGEINGRTQQIVGPGGLLGPHTYALMRTGSTLELRVDGASQATVTDPSIGTDVTSTADAFVGGCSSVGAGMFGAGLQNLSALIVVRGAVPAADLQLLEAFVRQVPSPH